MLTSRKSDKAVSSLHISLKCLILHIFACSLWMTLLIHIETRWAFMFERGANACAIQDDDCPCMMQATGV